MQTMNFLHRWLISSFSFWRLPQSENRFSLPVSKSLFKIKEIGNQQQPIIKLPVPPAPVHECRRFRLINDRWSMPRQNNRARASALRIGRDVLELFQSGKSRDRRWKAHYLRPASYIFIFWASSITITSRAVILSTAEVSQLPVR